MNSLKALKKSVFFISFHFSLIAFLFPVYAYSKGASTMEIGLIYSMFSLCTILMRPIVGALIDKKGRKVGITLGAIFYSLSIFLYLLDMDFKYILIARIVQSIAASFYWISVNTIISDISGEDNRAENFGIIEESLSKGSFLGVFIGFNIILNNLFKNSFQVVFLIYLGASLISLYYVVSNLEETIEFKKTYKEKTIKDSKEFKLFLVFMGIFSLISSLTAHTYLIYLRENITAEFYLISYLFLPGAILSMFLPNKFGRLSDRYNKKKILFTGIFITGILYLFIPLIKNYYYFMLMETLLTINSMFYGFAQSALVIDIVGENQRGKAYGKYSFVMGIGGAIGPLVGTVIYEHIGNATVFYVKGLMLIVFCLLIPIIFSISGEREKISR